MILNALQNYEAAIDCYKRAAGLVQCAAVDSVTKPLLLALFTNLATVRVGFTMALSPIAKVDGPSLPICPLAG